MTRYSGRAAVVSIGLIAVEVLFVAACDAGFVADAPPRACVEAGDQCPLPTGPLGVCEQTQCEDEAKPPCFACISQH